MWTLIRLTAPLEGGSMLFDRDVLNGQANTADNIQTPLAAEEIST